MVSPYAAYICMPDTYVRRQSQPEFAEKVSKVRQVGGGRRDVRELPT